MLADALKKQNTTDAGITSELKFKVLAQGPKHIKSRHGEHVFLIKWLVKAIPIVKVISNILGFVILITF